MKLDAPWLTAEAPQRVFRLLGDAGFQVFAVGGCVRNALLDAPINDIDMATDARPEQVVELAEDAGLKVVPTGIDHGTVTVIVDGQPFEVTTFRKDVETDGRHAVVAFSALMEDDARRRDFTMNALYADAGGTVLDPVGGLDDIGARRVRFIGEARDRIREDHLRSLRFFRFYAWYGHPDAGADPDGLAAIASELDGLTQLSRERVGAEMLRLLNAPDPAPAVAAMSASGVLGRVLPAADARALPVLVHVEQGQDLSPDAIRRLAALGGTDVQDRLRLSNEQARDHATLRAIATTTDAAPAELGYRHGAARALDGLVIRAAFLETPLPPETRIQVERGACAIFPITAADLMPDFQGAALGAELKRLENLWIDSDFALSRDDLLP